MNINYGSFWKSLWSPSLSSVKHHVPCRISVDSKTFRPWTVGRELGNFSRRPQKAAANFSRNGHCPTSHDVIFAMWKTMHYTSYTMYVFFFHGAPAFFPPCILFFKTLPLFFKPSKAAPWNSCDLLVCWAREKFAFGLGLHFGTRPIVMAHRVFDFWFLPFLIETLRMIRIKQSVWNLFCLFPLLNPNPFWEYDGICLFFLLGALRISSYFSTDFHETQFYVPSFPCW